MSEFATFETPANGRAARCGGARDWILLTMVLFAVVRTGQALAGDQAPNEDAKFPPDARAERLPLPSSLFSTDRSFADSDAFSATEFRPRDRSLAVAQSTAGARFGGDTPMLQDTTVWQQMMTDYKSQDRVRVLTLLETRGSSLSLQASKRGGPSLQWSSQRINHEGAARGLLDRLVSAALRGTGSQRPNPNLSPSRPAAPAAATAAALKPFSPAAAPAAQ